MRSRCGTRGTSQEAGARGAEDWPVGARLRIVAKVRLPTRDQNYKYVIHRSVSCRSAHVRCSDFAKWPDSKIRHLANLE